MARPFGAPAFGALALLLVAALAIPPASGVEAAATWPPSSSLLISEVQTGGASASDEFVELYSAAADPVDLAGLELAYASASGATVTRKVGWDASLVVEPGGHLLIANEAGAYVGLADATYSGGFAAAGGVVILRTAGGETIDSLAWGTADNDFVEGLPALAPAAGQSLERLPGGPTGSGIDTNDAAADFVLRDVPDPQGLASEPIPWPGPGASPSPSQPAPSSPSLAPSFTPSPTMQPSLTPSPISSPTATPSLAPTTPPTSSPPPTPTASATPAPTPIPIAQARGLADGTPAVVAGALTTPLGLVESGHAAFVQDASGGIGLYLGSADWPPLAAGTKVTVSGTVTSRYGQITLRLDAATDVVASSPAAQPDPVASATGTAGESLEGRLVAVQGTVTAGSDALSDGFAVTVDDGSGGLRVVAGAASGIAEDALLKGHTCALIGVLGQRDSSGTGTTGYRLYLRDAADIVDVTPAATPTPSPSSSGQPPATPSASPTPGPSDGSALRTIASARTLALGSPVTVRGVVTAEVGRVSDDRSLAIQDASGGIVVRLDAQRAGTGLARGTWIEVQGTLGQRHDDLEIRLADGSAPRVLGAAALPAPRIVDTGGLGESVEGSLVSLTGLVTERTRAQSGSLTVILEDASGRARAVFLPPAQAQLTDVAREAKVRVTGVAGQYSSANGRPDGYRIWARDLDDLVVLAAPPSGPDSGTGSPSQGGQGHSGAIPGGTTRPVTSGGDPGPTFVGLAGLAKWIGRLVRVAGRVEALEADRLTLEDDGGRVEVLLAAGLSRLAAGLRIGDLVNVVGFARLDPDGQPILQPRDLGDVTLAADLGQATTPASASGPDAGSSPTASPGPTALAGRPVDASVPVSSRFGLLALVLSVLLAGGAGLAFVARRW